MLTEIPEKWYVLYSNEKEFNVIKKNLKKDWSYYEGEGFGYTNINQDNNWVDFSSNFNNKEFLDKERALQLSFEDFEKYIIRKEPFVKPKKENLNYLITLFKKLNIK
jgi:hypothetical protein